MLTINAIVRYIHKLSSLISLCEDLVQLRHSSFIGVSVALGADINTQTEETQETALTLACCGGFLEVADFLIKAGADIELGCSTPLMEASQEGHLELVKYLLRSGKYKVETRVRNQGYVGWRLLPSCEYITSFKAKYFFTTYLFSFIV